jgi:nucleoside-diphosphate-sugar epimerase
MMEREMTGTALVIGATGGVGGEVARALKRHGWTVRALVRDPATARASGLDGVELIAGDAMIERDVVAASQGVSLIFHGANPRGYKNWRGLAIPMLRNAITAARSSGARLVFQGNVYNYGPDAGAVITETSPQHPRTRKGRIRVEMERMLRDAATRGARSLIVCAGDFFGGRSASSWFNGGLIKPGRPIRAVTYPGRPDVGHTWAYLPDLGETIAQLADLEASLPAFDTFNFGGHWIEPGIGMAEAILRAAGRPATAVGSFPWPLVYLGSPFVTFLRELIEMRYLWQRPLRLDNTKLLALLGAEPHTDLDTAVRRALTTLGCLPAASAG